MTDKLRESLSALIDGEASELEVHRLLRQIDSDDTLRPSWMSYLHVRTVIRGENVLTKEQHLALHRRISVAIGDEETYTNASQPKSKARYVKPAGLAIAASVFVAVIVTFTYTSNNIEGPAQQTVAETAAGTVASPRAEPVDAQMVSTESMVASDETMGAPQIDELKELTEDQQRQLRAYLNRHDRSRLDPNVRTVIYDKSKGN